jgi:3-ketosteroid 9alpha-monooxygenase subunit A
MEGDVTASRRPRFDGYPKGWFVIGFSDEYQPGTVKKHQYFGQALVAFRDELGTLQVKDGFCPHLGAHLGAGGRVEGNCIRCPFHHWLFAENGECVEIPYSDRPIPTKARLNPWTVREQNGLIYLWHHPQGGAPEFDLPPLPVGQDPTWLPWKHHILRIKTHSREIVENVVDIAHFKFVHGTHVEHFENRFEGHQAVQVNRGIAYPRGGGKDVFELEATYYGPGFQISDMRGVLQSMLINAHTMIDENTLDLRFAVSLRPGDNPERTDKIAEMYIDNLTKGFLEDVAIWENKTFRDVPVLCADDGPIMKLRKWYAQFFAPFPDGP